MNKYSISAVGAGDNVNVYVPSPLSTAVGPANGSQFQNGPVILTTDPPVFPHTSVVIIKSAGGGGTQIGYGQEEV